MSSAIIDASSIRKGLVMTAVVAIHVWVFHWLAGELRSGRRVLDGAEPKVEPIYLAAVIRKPRQTEQPPTSKTSTVRQSTASTAVSLPPQARIASQVVVSPDGAKEVSAIDLDATKTAAITAVLERDRVARQDAFTDRSTKPSIPMPKGVARSAIPWDRWGGKSIGLTEEGIFFARLSKRCTIVMVFLGCQFGGEVEPVGDIFEDIPAKLDRARESEVP